MGIQCSPVPRKCKSKGSGPDATLCNFANGGYGNKVGCAYIEYDDSDAMCENVQCENRRMAAEVYITRLIRLARRTWLL